MMPKTISVYILCLNIDYDTYFSWQNEFPYFILFKSNITKLDSISRILLA